MLENGTIVKVDYKGSNWLESGVYYGYVDSHFKNGKIFKSIVLYARGYLSSNTSCVVGVAMDDYIEIVDKNDTEFLKAYCNHKFKVGAYLKMEKEEKLDFANNCVKFGIVSEFMRDTLLSA